MLLGVTAVVPLGVVGRAVLPVGFGALLGCDVGAWAAEVLGEPAALVAEPSAREGRSPAVSDFEVCEASAPPDEGLEPAP